MAGFAERIESEWSVFGFMKGGIFNSLVCASVPLCDWIDLDISAPEEGDPIGLGCCCTLGK